MPCPDVQAPTASRQPILHAADPQLWRAAGTLLSGILYTYVGHNIVQGFAACFVASLVFVVLSSLMAIPIKDNDAGLACGPCLQLRASTLPDSTRAGAPSEMPEGGPTQPPTAVSGLTRHEDAKA